MKVEAATKLATARRSLGLSAVPLLPLLPAALVPDGVADVDAVFATGVTVLGWLDASKLLEPVVDLTCYHFRNVALWLEEDTYRSTTFGCER